MGAPQGRRDALSGVQPMGSATPKRRGLGRRRWGRVGGLFGPRGARPGASEVGRPEPLGLRRVALLAPAKRWGEQSLGVVEISLGQPSAREASDISIIVSWLPQTGE